MNVEQLRQLEQAATPGPWEVWDKRGRPYGHYNYKYGPGGWQRDGDLVVEGHLPRTSFGVRTGERNISPATFADAELIAAMRNCLPALLDIAELAREVTSPDYLTASGPYAEGVRLDAMRDLMAALARLDTEGGT